MNEILKLIYSKLKEMNYHFQTYNTNKVVYPYHIGSILPTVPTTEDGMKEYTFAIDSFTRGSLTELLKEVEKIEDMFPVVEGYQETIDNQFISIHYLTSEPIETGEDDLKRILTKLSVKTWKGK